MVEKKKNKLLDSTSKPNISPDKLQEQAQIVVPTGAMQATKVEKTKKLNVILTEREWLKLDHWCKRRGIHKQDKLHELVKIYLDTEPDLF